MTPKPEMPKPDKYDEAARALWGYLPFSKGWETLDGPERLAKTADFLRSAFPSAPSVAESAEDARIAAAPRVVSARLFADILAPPSVIRQILAVVGLELEPNALDIAQDKSAPEATKTKHGKTCYKEPHVSDGYLHGEDDDTPYFVDGMKYCGRCHMAI